MSTTIRRILLAVAVIIGGFLTMRLMDLLMLWSLYSWFFQTIRNASGMPDTLNGACSIWLVAITLMLLPTFFSVLFWKRDPAKVALVVTAVSGWLVIVYFMSLPKEGRFFNPMTGHAMYRYARTPNDKIDLFPLGYKYHPRYGTELQWVTQDVVKEIDQTIAKTKAAQETEELRKAETAKVVAELETHKKAAEAVLSKETKKEQSEALANLNQVASGTEGRGMYLEIRAEKIQVATDRLVVHLACITKIPRSYGTYLESGCGLGAYVVDDLGRTYNVAVNSPDTSIERSTRTIREGEAYRFTLAFPPLPKGASELKMYLPEFYPALYLDRLFAKSETIPALGTSSALTAGR